MSANATEIQSLINEAKASIPADQPIAWEPTPKQYEFLTAGEDETLYGGAAGGGKSDALVIDASGQSYGATEYPKYRAVLFRRTFDELSELIDRSRLYYSKIFPSAKYNESKHEWEWPSGAKVIFRYCRREEDILAHWGREYQYVGWDELTQHPTMKPYEFMQTRTRSTDTTLPCLIRATCNPNGPGHTWVKRHFRVSPLGDPNCFMEEVLFPDGHKEKFWRSFIPAKLTDNPYLMKDRRYMARLLRLPDRLKKALLEGRWDLTEGQFFNQFDYKIHVVKPFRIPIDWPRWRALDWGYRRPYSVGYYTMDPDSGKIFRYREVYGYGGEANVGSMETAGEVAKKLLKIEGPERSQGIKFKRNPADRSIWIEQGHGKEISIGEIFAKNGVRWMPASQGPRSVASRCALMQQLLADQLFFVFDTCEHWIRTVPELQVDEDDPEVYDTDMEDHAADETGYSLVSRHQAEGKSKQKAEGPKPGTFDYMIRQTEEPKKKHPYRL